MTMRVLGKNKAYEDFLTVSESGHFSVIAPNGRTIQVLKGVQYGPLPYAEEREQSTVRADQSKFA